MTRHMKKKVKFYLSFVAGVIGAIALLLLVIFSIIDVNKGTQMTSATAMTDTSVRLTWKRFPSAHGYELFQKKEDGEYIQLKVVDNLNTTLYNVKNLTPATRYYYKVRTYKLSGDEYKYSYFSDEISVVTKPVGTVVKNASETNGKVTIKWDKVDGVAGYSVCRISDSDYKELADISDKTTATVKGKTGDVFTVKTYIMADGKKLYSVPAEEFIVIDGGLSAEFDSLKNVITQSGVNEKDAENYTQQARNWFRRGRIFDSYFVKKYDKLKAQILKDVASSYSVDTALDEIKNNIIPYCKEDTQWRDKNWVALGTSLTAPMVGKYVDPLAELSSMSVTNLGVDGAVMGGHIMLRAQLEDSLEKADLITVEGSINDFSSAIPLGKVGDTVPYYHNFTSPEWDNDGTEDGTFAGACYQVFKIIQQKAPDAVVVCLTDTIGRDVPESGAHLGRDTKNKLGYTQQDYNNMLIAVAQYMGVEVIDTATLSGISEDNPEYYADHIHHSKLGGEKFADTVWQELKKIQIEQ